MSDNKLWRAFRYGPILFLIAVLPYVLPNEFYVRIAGDVAFLAIAAIGLNILIGLSGQLSIGHAGFFAIGGYTSAILSLQHGWPIWLSMPAGVIAAMMAGLLMGMIALRTRTHYLAMATLAFGFIVEIVAQRWVGLTGGSMGLLGLPILSFGSFQDAPKHFLWVVGVAYLIVQIGSDYVISSEWGRRLRAVKESESFAATIGLDVKIWRSVTFVVSAMIVGLAGTFFVHQSGYVSSDAFGLDRSISFLIAVVVGGLGRSYGAILGAVVVIALGQLTANLYQISYFIYGSIFLVVMLLFPAGVSGLIEWVTGQFSSDPKVEATEDRCFFDTISKGSQPPDVASDALVLDDVSKFYFGVKAVDGISFSVRPQTIHALIGPNGAGKSTVINVISGLYRATSGKIRVFGTSVETLSCSERVPFGLARSFQNLQLIGSLSVVENVMLGLPREAGFFAGLVDWLSTRKVESKQHADAMGLLQFFGIARFANSLAGDLAYGHRKLLEMARALAQQPSIMLLDEPVAGLNEEEAREVADVIRKLPELGITVLLVEHNMQFVMAISDRVTVLDYGRIIAEGAPKDIQSNAAVIEAYLGPSSSEQSEPMRKVV